MTLYLLKNENPEGTWHCDECGQDLPVGLYGTWKHKLLVVVSDTIQGDDVLTKTTMMDVLYISEDYSGFILELSGPNRELYRLDSAKYPGAAYEIMRVEEGK